MKKCNKCDERGYIVESESPYFAHSCECGWAIEQTRNYFKDWTLQDLVSFKNRRNLIPMFKQEYQAMSAESEQRLNSEKKYN